MTAFAIVNFIAAGLELCVPTYALRLVRRFGVSQVGSFVIIAFVSLALLHMVNQTNATATSHYNLSFIYGASSILLLIGLGHTETVCRERQQARVDAENLRTRIDTEARERAENLLQIKQEMAQEIVRLQQQVEALSSSERQYRLLFSQYPHPVWMYDLRNGRILLGNQAALSQYGFSQQEFSSLCAKDLLAREATEAFIAETAKPCSSLEPRGIWRHRRKDRTIIDVEVMALDLRFGDCPARLMFTEDIGPRQAREAQLCEQQSLRTLRQVAEGIAHHFGQILGGIEQQAGFLHDQPVDSNSGDPCEQIVGATRRGGALVRQLLAAGACCDVKAEAMDLNRFILDRQALLGRVIGDRIELHFQLGQDLSPVLADARTLEHILLNLVINARQALPLQGGVIEIQSRCAWAEAAQDRVQPNAVPGHYVGLTVRDNGCGMGRDVQRHLFEPFFTTRDDTAMGLGLAMVYGAVKQFGGWVDVASEPHQGTEFRIFLPVARLTGEAQVSEKPVATPGSRETILLVEPNDRVRDLARHILQRNGYRVVEIDSPSTAMLLMESLASQAHLLLIDLSFPTGESGRDLADHFVEMNPSLKVVYAGAPIVQGEDNPASVPEHSRLLLKPYTPDQLLQAVASSLTAA